MQTRELSLLGALDNGLTKVICHILLGLKNSILWLMGLVTFIALPFLIFEYNQGLADLSQLEWVFIPLLGLLLWRHIAYCKYHATGFGRGLSYLFKAQGVMVVVELVVIGTVATVLMGTKELQLLDIFMMETPITKLITLFTVLLATYLAAPTKPLAIKLAEPDLQHLVPNEQKNGKEAVV
jgi:hypothetical protein